MTLRPFNFFKRHLITIKYNISDSDYKIIKKYQMYLNIEIFILLMSLLLIVGIYSEHNYTISGATRGD
jgi:hypothetical protein